ncbi:hypothetical protein B0F90DRAFT_1300460 [Multifurca ochricompacta]|uniref:Nephrocystin 3-like N-terminal domain-containing protein n=1 Tax=Multifurca ochricompacta TaxID=376703 RepID=A0AAD4QNH2_9AGAM|nr:hypothetical protein B0F90DRAFT_1300460 [Multifurca ochricompacta]
MAYFYFDFKDSGKQDCRGLVSSLLSQLCARSDPCCGVLLRWHSRLDDCSRQPREDEFIRCLKETLSLPGQSNIYIIVDVLGECPNNSGMPSSRERLMRLIRELVAMLLPRLHVCILGRPEVDIRIVLDPLTSHRVPRHEEQGQSKDVSNYVMSVIKSDPKLQRWRADDRQLVIDSLSQRADGMLDITITMTYAAY